MQAFSFADDSQAKAACKLAPSKRFLWKLWGVAFLVRLAGVGLSLLFIRAFLIPDDTVGLYYPIARSLAAGTGYQVEGSFLEASRSAPVLPLWLALLMRVAGPDLPLWLPGLFHAAFRAAGVVLLYRLARRYFGRPAALGGAVLYLLDPWETLWVGYVMKEALAVPLFLLAVWLLCRLADQRSLRSACVAGAAIGLATLARFPNSALWVAAGLMLLGGLLGTGQGRWAALRRAAALYVCLTGAFGVVLVPWLIRNWYVVGQPVLSPHFAGQKFYTSNGPGIEMERDGYYGPQGIDHAMLARLHQEKVPWQREGHLFVTTLQYVRDRPLETAQRIAIKLVNMWRPTFAVSSLRNWLVLGLPYCGLMALSWAGVLVALRRRISCPAIAVPLCLFIGVHLVFWGEIRNRQYLTPLFYTFGGLFLADLQPWSYVRRALQCCTPSVAPDSASG